MTDDEMIAVKKLLHDIDIDRYFMTKKQMADMNFPIYCFTIEEFWLLREFYYSVVRNKEMQDASMQLLRKDELHKTSEKLGGIND
jgi:hypothetical protein